VLCVCEVRFFVFVWCVCFCFMGVLHVVYVFIFSSFVVFFCGVYRCLMCELVSVRFPCDVLIVFVGLCLWVFDVCVCFACVRVYVLCMCVWFEFNFFRLCIIFVGACIYVCFVMCLLFKGVLSCFVFVYV